MTSAATVAAGVLFLLAYMGIVLGLRSFCRWAVRREEARHAAATFDADYIATPDAVLAQEEVLADAERTVLVEDMLVLLDEALEHLDGLRS